jgi:hypothetical protein
MAQFSNREKETIRVACSVIRDLTFGWPVKDLVTQPADVCKGLSDLIGDTYDFKNGIVTRVTTNDSGDQHDDK